MDYVKKFLHVEGIIGQGAFGRILVTSPLQNILHHQQPQRSPKQPQPSNEREPPSQKSGGELNNLGHLSQHLAQKDQTKSPFNPQALNTNQDRIHKGPRFALKCVHPIVKPQRLANELRHLRDLGGVHNVVQMHTAHFYRGSLYIVMDLFEHDKFIDIVAHLELEEIVMYMANLLEALEHVHSHGILHRDIKPANFLFNRKNKKFLLVDFGLAQVARTRTGGLFGNRAWATNSASSPANALLSAPTTPTSTQSRRSIAYSKTPLIGISDSKDKRLDNHSKLNDHLIKTSIVNLNSTTHIIHQSPARHLINLTPTGSPSTPNVGTKRHRTEVNNTNVNQLLKKLRVSNKDDEIREPVKLTVGAYESPVTNSDSGNKRTINHHNHKFSTPIVPSRRNYGPKCDCREKPRTCSTCQARPDPTAPKSGTPGYKAPEVLLRYMNQTTAIDIWSAGVIFACLLSGHAPFFRDADDNASLAEIITLLGSQRVTQAAKAIGICLSVQPKREPVDIMQLCRTIRLKNKDKRQIDIHDEAFDLLNRMLDPNPSTRITAREALKHTWFKDYHISEPNEGLN